MRANALNKLAKVGCRCPFRLMLARESEVAVALRHIVTWQVEGETRQARAEVAARLAEELQALNGKVPSLRRLEAHPNSVPAEGNWDLVLIADFDDEAGLSEYLVHPAHQEAAFHVRAVAVARSAVDFAI